MTLKVKCTILLLILSLSLALLVAACGASKSNSANQLEEKPKPITIRLATELPESQFIAQAGRQWANTVNEKSGGKVIVEYFPAAQLYKGGPQALEAVQNNTLDAALTFTTYLVAQVPQLGIFEVPMLFESNEAGKKAVADPEMGGLLLSRTLEKSRVYPLAWWSYGTGQFYSKKTPYKVPTDFKGQIVRVTNDVMSEGVKALGGTPVYISSGEIYTALERGTINGYHQGVSTVLERHLYEVSSAFVNSNHSIVVGAIFFNSGLWDKLPKNIQELLVTEAKKLSTWTFDEADRQESNGIVELQKKGMNYYELKPEERALWHEVLKPVRESWMEKVPESQKLVDRVSEIKI